MKCAIVIPYYNSPLALKRVISEIPKGRLGDVFVVDDESIKPAVAPEVRVVRHPKNRGYGGSQKTGYRLAKDWGAEAVVLLHGDGQYDTQQVLGLVNALEHKQAVLGSRFLVNGGLNIPLWRRMGNKVLTRAVNMRFGTNNTELHTGARGYRIEALEQLRLDEFSEGYLFDHQLLLGLIRSGVEIAERPVSAKYDDTVQSIGFVNAVRYGFGCLGGVLKG